MDVVPLALSQPQETEAVVAVPDSGSIVDEAMIARAAVIAQAWESPEYRTRLREDPRPLLRDAGWDVPSDTALTVVEDTATDLNVVLQSTETPAEDVSIALSIGLNAGMAVHVYANSPTHQYLRIPLPPLALSENL
jgi:hypothetical protein